MFSQLHGDVFSSGGWIFEGLLIYIAVKKEAFLRRFYGCLNINSCDLGNRRCVIVCVKMTVYMELQTSTFLMDFSIG